MSARPRKSELDLEHRPGYRLSILAALSTRVMAGLLDERAGLTVSLWRVLSIIGARGPLSAGEVAQRSSLDPDKVTRAVDGLVARRLAARTADPRDRRRVLLALTPRGRRIYAELDGLRREIDVKFLSILSETERQTFFALLDRLEQQARRIFTGREAWRALVPPAARVRRAARI